MSDLLPCLADFADSVGEIFRFFGHDGNSADTVGGIRQHEFIDSVERISAAGHSSAARFPLPWSHYVRLLSVANPLAREFYETEALRGGWTVRQLDRQIGSQFYERTALSRNKAAVLRKGGKPHPEDAISPDEEIRDPLVLGRGNSKSKETTGITHHRALALTGAIYG